MSLHIVFLCNEYPPSPGGGIGTFYQTLGRALVKQGWEVTVVGYYRSQKNIDKTDDCGVRVWRLPASRETRGRFHINMVLDRLRLGWWVRALSDKRPYDLLESADYQGLSWAMPNRAPIIVRIHGADLIFMPLMGIQPHPWKAYFEKQALLNANYVVGSSSFITDQAERVLGSTRTIAKTIYNMVDVETFSPRKNIQRDRTTVASVSTITPKKGVYQLLDAWQLIHLTSPNSILYYYGRDTLDNDGLSNQDKLKAIVREKQLTGNVRFMGAIPYTELPNLFCKIGVLVFPSFLEAHPRVWLEAMATGSPIIGSTLGPGPEIIDNSRTGLLADPNDINDLARKIEYLLQRPVEAKQFGENARLDMIERFSVEVILKQNTDFFHSCIG